MNTMTAGIAAAALLMLGLAAAGTHDYGDSQAEQAFYCDMVRLHDRTGGEYGWPDYNGNAADICED